MGTWADMLNINVLAKSSFAIVAVLALLVVIGYFTLGIDVLIDIAWRLGVTVILGGVAIGISKAYMSDLYKLIGIMFCVLIIVLLWLRMM